MNHIAANRPACPYCNFNYFCSKHNNKEENSPKFIWEAHKEHRLKAKETLRLSKKSFTSLYAVQSGALKAYQIGHDGKELIRGFYFAGEVLGYEAIYPNQYFFSALALVDTVVCEFAYSKILEQLHEQPNLHHHLMCLMSKQLNLGSCLISTTAEQRLATFLIHLSQRININKMMTEFILPMSRQDIGNYLGLTAETISRIFSRLQKNNLVQIYHKKLLILNSERLKQIAEGAFSLA